MGDRGFKICAYGESLDVLASMRVLQLGQIIVSSSSVFLHLGHLIFLTSKYDMQFPSFFLRGVAMFIKLGL